MRLLTRKSVSSIESFWWDVSCSASITMYINLIKRTNLPFGQPLRNLKLISFALSSLLFCLLCLLERVAETTRDIRNGSTYSTTIDWISTPQFASFFVSREIIGTYSIPRDSLRVDFEHVKREDEIWNKAEIELRSPQTNLKYSQRQRTFRTWLWINRWILPASPPLPLHAVGNISLLLLLRIFRVGFCSWH